MQKAALNVSGIVFLGVAVLHMVRLGLKIPVTFGQTSIPLMASAVGAVVALLLALWMFVVARKSAKTETVR
ncbi:MAG: hypothetical protein A2351_00375 [Omnitrophica bacterium RIFOXYB12_FULL_50_7]|nr:MAG: hypothetical protein A2351_00375 [Omnitrophica bacterium RIFOXYB12_FULL_50_7]